jgi:hypothetical protein
MLASNHCFSKSAKLASALACALALQPIAAKADVVSDWNATATTVILNKGAFAGIYLAMVHVAIYDAVNSVDRRYSVYAVTPAAPTAGASKDAAAASAAYNLLSSLFPDQSAVLDPAFAASLAAIPDGAAETKGVAIGAEVASGILALRANDGRNAVVPYVFGSGPGVYQATPPAFASPLAPWVAKVTPFALTRPSQFRAYGPPDVTSAHYAADFNTVKSLGSINSVERTAEQTEIGRFHTENPNVFWTRNLRNLAAARSLGIEQSARFFAMVFVAFGDANIACWDSKYYFNSWRPITAISAAASDDNPATEADAAWVPLANTPPHPEYPAAHGCATGAIAEALRQFFGTKHVNMVFTSTVPGSIPHAYATTEDLVKEVQVARVYGGMHFPTSTVHGAILGRQVGRYVAKNYFLPVKR